ncbi:MAG: hypothetical protein LZF60_160137 [Nitrospira sp.]|nr:MAG: hypothetical protein LZF60_160137 [Nitrospira sp.]
MEITSNLQGEQLSQSQDESDEALSATFREWAEAMSREQVLHLLAHGSAEHMVENLERRNLPLPPDPARTWRLLKAELVARLQTLTALQGIAGGSGMVPLPQEVSDEVLIGRFQHVASEMTPGEIICALRECSPEGMRAYFRHTRQYEPTNPEKLVTLFRAELMARAKTLRLSLELMGNA